MADNKTPHRAEEYDDKVRREIPFYDIFHEQCLDVARHLPFPPEKWLDTGCGTGNLVKEAAKYFPGTCFYLADPSGDMLKVAASKLSGCAPVKAYVCRPTQDLDFPDGFFDVITAVQCHHYMDQPSRQRAARNCWRMLKAGGVYLTFEHIRPASARGAALVRERWLSFQISRGKTPEEAEMHLDRYDREYFPITISQHMALLGEVGFKNVEILWASYMQTGFLAMKE